MPIVWPVTVPPLTEVENLKETISERSIRSTMDAGPAKVRFNSNAIPDKLTFSQTLTTSQVNDLETFYITTLNGGAVTFDDLHPRLLITKTLRFTEPPSWEHVGGPLWRSQISLEVMP